MSTQKKIKVGILGFGNAGGTMHTEELGFYPEMFELYAMCDFDLNRHAAAEKDFPAMKRYSCVTELLADPEIDLVTVATRNCDHTMHAMQVLEAGKAVVVEKPIAVSVEQSMELAYAAERFPGKVFLRHNRRFEPAFNHVKEIIDSGKLGDVYAVRVHRHPTFGRRFDWQTTSAAFGGLLNNWGPHMIDQALQLLDSPVVDLWSDMQHRVAAGTADDYFKIILRGENRRVVDVEVSGNTTLPDSVYYAEGSRGSLVVPLEETTVQLKYLDPDFKFSPRHANYGNRTSFGSYGVNEDIPWIEETVPIAPANGRTKLHMMWPAIYESMVNNVPYPIKIEEGLDVVRVTEWARQVSGFVPHPIEGYND